MSIENNIFKRYVIIWDRLIPYGFNQKNNIYIYKKIIMDNSFNVIIEINAKSIVKGKIIDLSFDCEYTNYRIENGGGKFANSIRDEFEKILLDIRSNCFKKVFFISNQANRICDLITLKYGDKPVFLWDKSPGSGVFKNEICNKWYAAILDVNRKIFGGSDEIVEILNVKLNDNKIKMLLQKPGFFPAYHMNKKNWITIILDDTLPDQEIMEYISDSYECIYPNTAWIVPANPNYYDIINYFNSEKTILWKQIKNIKVNDYIYIYVTHPYSAIMYECQVLEIGIPENESTKNMNYVMKLGLIRKLDPNDYSLSKLTSYGITAVRCPRRMPSKLYNDIHC